MTEQHSRLEDPFAHLHEEDFERNYMVPRLGVEGMICTSGRASTSLNGDWHFVLDPFREGLRQKWFAHDATPIEQWTTPRDYDEGAWQTLAVPGCWNLAKPEWFHYEGAAWLSRSFEIDALAEERCHILRFGAASGRCRLFLNGAFIGLHLGSHTPFFVDLTDHLVEGENRLMVELDTTRRADSLPMHHFDWFNYGGIHRDVELFALPKIYIKAFRTNLLPDGKGVEVNMELSSPANGEAVLTIGGLGAFAVSVSDGQGRARLDCQPDLWSPNNPRLYDVRLEWGCDHVKDRIGFRHIARSGHDILLNGAPVELRGICVHEDDRETGRCSSEADIRRRFGHIKELGCNAARLAHYPHHELAARIADEMGILLWEEIPVYWAIDFANPETLADAKNQLREMITRDYNRASVILWGIGNENADTDARLAFMRSLAQTARVGDPTRLIGAACLINRQEFRIEDRLATHLDVIGLNEYFGWYEPGFDGLKRLLANSDPDRPVVISETGAEAKPGLRGDLRLLFSEDLQAHMLAEQVRLADECPYIAGIFPWLLYDFRSQRRQTIHQQGWNRKGLIAEDKQTRKAGFDALQSAYKQHFNKGRTDHGNR